MSAFVMPGFEAHQGPTRQVRRLAPICRGPAGVISKRFNQPSNNRTDDAVVDAVVEILRSTYADFGPTLATEKAQNRLIQISSQLKNVTVRIIVYVKGHYQRGAQLL